MAKAITLERAVWEAFFWPENVPRYMEASKDGTLEEVWARNVSASPDRDAVVTADGAATYATLDAVAVSLSGEITEGCQFAILAGLRPVPRLAAALASTKAGCVPVFLDAPSEEAVASLNLGASKVVLLGDSNLPINPETVIASGALDQALRGAGAHARRAEAAQAPRRSGKVIIFSEEGLPLYLGEKAQNNRLDCTIAFFSMKRGATIFHAGRAASPLWNAALGLSLRLGGTFVSGDSLSTVARLGGEKGLRYDYGFLDPAEEPGPGTAEDGNALRERLGTCAWVASSNVDPRAQSLAERALRVPVLGCLARQASGLVLSNHYSWNVHGSFGIPLPNAEAAIQTKTGPVLATGQAGELIVSGPQIDRESAPKRPMTAPTAASAWLKTGVSAEVDLNGLIHPFVQK